jgi:tRNA G26 N,N-dimethylase Trm1
MIIARDVKIVPRAAGEWDNTSSAMMALFARVAYNIFSTSEHKNEKKTTINNSSVLCVLCEKCNKHSLFARS